MASAKWRAKSHPAKIYRYLEGGEHLTYRMVILHRLQCNAKEISEEIVDLEEKREWLNKNLQDTQQLPKVLLKVERTKEIEKDLKKMKKKLQKTKVDLTHSKKMVAFTATDQDYFDESKEWSERITNNKENL